MSVRPEECQHQGAIGLMRESGFGKVTVTRGRGENETLSVMASTCDSKREERLDNQPRQKELKETSQFPR